MRIELLYFDDCPSYAALLPRLRELLASEGVEGEVELRLVETTEEAKRERFLGSPTVRIDGEDVEPGSRERDDFGMKCRLYRSEDGLSKTPPEHWIRAAMVRAPPSRSTAIYINGPARRHASRPKRESSN